MTFPRSLIPLVASLAACSAGNPPPEGFVEACYGGDWNKRMVGLAPVWSADLTIDDDDLPTLRTVFAGIAAEYSVKHYDVGEKFIEVRPIDIYLCSEEGLFISATKLGRRSPIKPVMINIFVYEPDYKWEPIGQDLRLALVAKWPESLDETPSRTSELGNSLL